MTGKLVLGIALSTFLMGCASNKLSWDTLRQNIDDPNYCKITFSEHQDVENCEIEMTARKRAKDLCSKETKVDYCELMAAYAWDGHKFYIKDKATMESARRYPITCGWDEKVKRPCQ